MNGVLQSTMKIMKQQQRIWPCSSGIYSFISLKYIEYILGQGSSVGIGTDYGLDGPVSNPGGDEIFRPSRPILGPHPASCTMGTGSFLGVRWGRGVLLTTHPPRSWKSRAIPLPTLWATPGLYRDHFTFTFIYMEYITNVAISPACQ